MCSDNLSFGFVNDKPAPLPLDTWFTEAQALEAARRLQKSLMAVFSGITISIFTPNRIGEYFGRVFILKKKEKVWTGLVKKYPHF